VGGREVDLQEAPGLPLGPGTVLGKYRIVRLLGEGGMGAVWEGVHLEMGKRVAVKTMHPALAAVPEARARFVLEAQLTSRVRHPHTVDVTDIGTEGGQAFLVMEYLEGEDLARHLRRVGPLPLDEVVDIALPILAAVAAAHDVGIVHRDLKPQNIFLAEVPGGGVHPKVLDFGISKAPAYSSIKTSGVILGSPIYFAPEQVTDSKTIGPATDQYALGVVLYECATGRLPYEGSNLAHIFHAIVEGRYPPPRSFRGDLPEGLDRIIVRAMHLDPAERYANLREMGRAMLDFASPKTRLLWQDHFSTPSAGDVAARSGGEPSPVPVTVQTPGSSHMPIAETQSILAQPPSERVRPGAPGGWILPVRVPPGDLDGLVIPRKFRALRWVVGVGALVASAWVVGFMVSGRHRPVQSVPASVAQPPASRQAQRRDEKPGAEAETIAEPPSSSPAPTARQAHKSPAVRRPRLGSNQAPLIE
jgi:serine/threonine protein kinase